MIATARMSQRAVFGCGALICAGLMATALFMQHVMGLEPCPLCVLQRVVVIGIGLVMLAAAVQNPGRWGRRVYGALLTLSSGAGIAVAGRHVWLQHLPADQVPECGPGLEYMLKAFPLSEALAMVFQGSGECAEVLWRFLGLSIPEWTLAFFILFTLFGVYLLLAPSRG